MIRSVSLFVVLVLSLTWSTQNATAEQLGAPSHLSFASVSQFLHSLFEDTSAPLTPQQQSGSAAGRSHDASTASTRARGGHGQRAGRGKGQLPAYAAHLATGKPGLSGKAGTGRFDAKTSKLIGSKSSATVSWYQNTDGSITRNVSEYPVNYEVSPGVWAPIDTRLTAAAGRYTEGANSLGVSFASKAPASVAGPASDGMVRFNAGASASPSATPSASASPSVSNSTAAASGSTGDLAQVQVASGESVGWSLSGSAPVAASVSGSTATYADILPDTTVSETAGPTGDKESIFLASAAAGNTWTFPLDTQGLTPSLDSEGAVQFADGTGAMVARIPLAFAQDSKVNPVSGDPATTWNVKYSLAQATGGGWVLTVTLDAGWLSDPARVFPVTVDPTLTVSIVGKTATTYVDSTATGDFSSSTVLKGGECVASPCGASSDEYATSFIAFSGSSPQLDNQGYYASSVSLNLFDVWTATTIGAANCTSANQSQFSWSEIDVAPVTQAWSVTGSKAYPGPAFGAKIGSASPATWNACKNTSLSLSTGDWVAVSLDPTWINDWSFGSQPDYGLAVSGPQGALTWRKYDSDMESSYTPYLSVTYVDQAPQISAQYPPNGYSATTLTPELLASAVRPANSQTTTSLTYDFSVYDGSNNKVADSGSISAGEWTVPSGDLTWGQTYYWTVTSSDGTLTSIAPPLAALSIAVPQPVITSTLSQNTDGHGFDQSIGNYTTEATDAQVTSVGPALDVTRDYNSLDPRTTGAFGAAWSSIFDARAKEQDNAAGAVVSVTVTYPDGSQVGFGKNSGGSFSPPAGRFATFKAVTGGYTLTDKNDTMYTFTQSLGSGAYGITAITDVAGRAVNFAWASGEITTMSSAVSGRALHVTWSTPTGATHAHVASVYTDPVTGTDQSTDLTWKYFYTGDQLTEACDPKHSGSCTGVSSDVATKYAYTAGSLFQDAALDAGAHSLWPLSEASGTTANSAVLANEGNDNATYSNVTLGASAPFSGSTATSASFNGTSSYVTLPQSLVTGSEFLSIGLWFKTTTAGGILLDEQNQPMGTTPSNATPSLYVGTDGKLHGQWYTGSLTAQAVSTSAVADGKWHFALLSGAGNTQTLYLDGNAQGSAVSGTINNLAQAYTYVGGGYSSADWPQEPAKGWSYFKGQVADVMSFTRGLVAADVTGLYQAGAGSASLLNGITRPSGNTEATVTYDAASARVTSVVNENGGHWTINPPTVVGTSDAYRAAVLGSAPAGYYRLGEAAGSPSALSEVNYGSGTYYGVTLGASGPFADKTAASFDGSSSYLQLPQTDQVATGPNSVEMWFKMTAGNINGGVLFDEEQCPITNNPTCGGWDPALYVGTDGRLHGQFWINNIGATIDSPQLVNDGKWHHVVLAASTSSQTLYLDGNAVGTQAGTLSATALGYIYVGAGEAGGAWKFAPTNPLGYFSGSIAEMAFYRSQLSAAQVAAHYAAYKSGVAGISPTQVSTVVDPGGKMLTYKYDLLNGDRLISETDGTGATTSYGYDSSGFLYTVTDPNGNVTTTGHDVRGNEVSSTTCQNQAGQVCSSEYFTYYPDDTTAQLTTADPRNDVVVTSRDGRSSSATDNTYLTSYTYDSFGDRTVVTTPPVPGFPNGRSVTVTYSDGTAAYPAVDGGNVPAGLPVSSVSPGGATTTTAYYHNGDTAAATDADGQVTKFVYDGIGRVLTKTVDPGSPLAWWQLNQTSGTAVPDASGTGHTGTASNVTWSGGAGVFNGTSSQITSSGSVVNTGASFTMSAWVNLSSAPTTYASVINIGGVNNQAASLLYSPGGKSWVFQTTSADVGYQTENYYSAASPTQANSGNWYHLVGVYDATAKMDTLYVNGTAVATAGAPSSWAGKQIAIGTQAGGFYLPGSIANIQLYQRALSASDVSGLYAAGYSGSTVSTPSPNGKVTSYGYDQLGQVLTETDPPVLDHVTGATHTAVTTTTYDADGNVTAQSIADASGGDATRNVSSHFNAYNQEESSTDGDGNTTTYGYDTYGNKTKVTDANGVEHDYTFDADGRELTEGVWYGGDSINPTKRYITQASNQYDPAGRLASQTDAVGTTTKYTYFDDGLTATVTEVDANGANPFVAQSNTYDAAGNLISRSSDNNTTTTSYTVDASDRTTATTLDPGGLARTTSYSYTPDDAVATSTVTDATGASQVTDATYDPNGNETSQSVYADGSGHPVGWWRMNQTTGSTVTDASGTGNTAVMSGGSWTGSSVSFPMTAGQQITTNGPVLNTTGSYSVSAWAQLAGTSGWQDVVTQDGNQNSGFYLQYDPTDNAWAYAVASTDATNPSITRVHATTSPTTGTWYHLVATYNASTGAMTLYVNGAVAASGTDTTPIATSGSLAIGRGKYNGSATDPLNGQVANVQVYNRTLSAAEVTTLDSAGQNGGTVASSPWNTTSWQLDQRGLPVSKTDANGNITDYTYDEAGNLAVTTEPAVSTEVYNPSTGTTSPVQAHPVTMVGYNTFGEQAESEDADGNVTTTTYDAEGQVASTILPNYTPPGSNTLIKATEVRQYDKAGNLIAQSDPLGNTTNYTVDQMGRVLQETAPDGGVTNYTYTDTGDLLSTTDPTGAVNQATYDYLGRKSTATTIERYPSQAALTTNYVYNTAGNLAYETTPAGVKTSYGYNTAGETTQVTDGANTTTTYRYDLLGRKTATIYPDNSSDTVSYDSLGDVTGTAQLDASGHTLATTSATYDAEGHALSSTDALGHASTFTYDATGFVTQEIQPVSATTSITTSFGYDAAGNRTRYTDGRGNSWYYTYNPWNKQETQVEPATSTYNTAANSTITTAYDADGRVTDQSLPGGLSLTDSYDAMGQLTGQSGAGANAPTATRSFTYDKSGNMLTAATTAVGTQGSAGYQPATSETFTYNDRGLLLTAAGSAGSSSFGYTTDGLTASRTDAAGTTNYTYDTADRLYTVNDPLSGATATYGYNSLSQVTSIGYATGSTSGDQRQLSYDSSHRLAGDTLTNGSTTIASIGYGYDANGNLTSKTTTGYAGAAANTYTYDWANRLTSWNNGSATTNYSYDASGNRTQVGANVYTYDARDELSSDGVNSYTYTADGDLQQETPSGGGTVTSTTDAYGQQITQGTQSYALDALGRTLTDTTISSDSTSANFQYSGQGEAIATDGSYDYTYTPTGSLIGQNQATASAGSGQLALVDQHTDVVGGFTAAATTLSGSVNYDPLGNVTASSGTLGNLGYQSAWTDPGTKRAEMGARWYNPATGQFQNRDTAAVNPAPNSAAANPYAYAADDPMTETDPSGHCPVDICGGGYTQGTKQIAYNDHARKQDNWHWSRTEARDNDRAWRIGVARERALRAAEARAAAERARHHHSWWGGVWSSVTHIAHAAARIAVKAAKVAYQMSGAADVVGCVTHPTLMGCIQGALAIASVIPVVGEAGMLFRAATMIRRAAEIGNRMLPFLQAANEARHGDWRDALESAAMGAFGGRATRLGGKAIGAARNRISAALERDASRTLTDAEGAALRHSEQDALQREPHKTQASCPVHSFVGATPVLMAGGSSKPISQVKIGDKIANSVPGSAVVQVHTVTNVIVTKTDHDFVTVTIGKPGKDGKSATVGTLTTTFHHPFYDITQAAFVDAQHLKPGDKLQTTPASKTGTPASGTGATRDGPVPTVTVLAIHLYHADTVTYDLTIGDLHTYYVEAGTTPVLVHNCNVALAAGAKQLADDIHGKISYPLARDAWRTTAVTVAQRGDGSLVHLVTGSGAGLEKAQLDYIKSLGRSDIVVAGNMAGAHAEETAVHYMASNDLTPLAGGTSRNACAPDGCEDFLSQVGAQMIGPVTLGTKAKIPGQSMYAWSGHEAWTNFLVAAGYK